MLQFFPSRQITLYMARLFLIRTLAVLAMLVLVLQTLDLLGESGKILAAPGNGQSAILYYISLRAPQIISFFLPFSVLLGTLITFTALSQNSEVVSMKAAGLSAHQILAPMIVASLMVACISFVFNDAVVAPSYAKLKRWQDVEYGTVPADTGVKLNVWVREGEDILNAAQVSGSGDKTILTGVSAYLRNKGGLRRVLHGNCAMCGYSMSALPRGKSAMMCWRLAAAFRPTGSNM
jgi:lipopolysaccharide export system permease protein